MKEMSIPEKSMLRIIVNPSEPLPYKLKKLEMPEGFQDELEYEIPEDKKEEVLKALYPFMACPELDEVRFDLHSQSCFVVKDYRVIRYDNRNLLVAPDYDKTGGMVCDWIVPDELQTSCTSRRS